jgi:hypothetical protein
VTPSDPLPRARRRARVSAILVLLIAAALAVGGCSSSGSSTPESQSGGSATATGGSAPMASTVTIGKVAGNVHQPFKARFAARKQGVANAIGHAVDAWLDGAYVGVSYPRDSFDAAFTTFTPGARQDAEHDKSQMTLWDLRHSIDGVTTTHRTVAIDVLAPRGKAAGATARVDLRFTTSGKVEQKVEVTGRLFLTRSSDGTWRIFGYDISKGARG